MYHRGGGGGGGRGGRGGGGNWGGRGGGPNFRGGPRGGYNMRLQNQHLISHQINSNDVHLMKAGMQQSSNPAALQQQQVGKPGTQQSHQQHQANSRGSNQQSANKASPQQNQQNRLSSEQNKTGVLQQTPTSKPQTSSSKPQQQQQQQQAGAGKQEQKSQTSTPTAGGLPQRDANKGKTPSVTAPPASATPQNGGAPKGAGQTPPNASSNALSFPSNVSSSQHHQQLSNRSAKQDHVQKPHSGRGQGRNSIQSQPSSQQTPHHPQQSQPQQQQTQNQITPNSDDPNSDNTKLFIATVKQGITDNEFKELFSKFGKVKEVYLNKHKWFGLVTFETHAEADAARKHYTNSNILKLKWAQVTPKETPLILNQNQDQALTKKESSSKCRLFVGNLLADASEENIRKLFEPYGTILELFVPPGKGFAFVRYETRSNAEAAKNALDGQPFANRQLQIRFASQGAVLKVRNLSSFVTNELLFEAFEPFGELERATVFVDERGKSLGEGILEFTRKPVAVGVMRKAQLECLLLTTSPLPVIIEPMEVRDDEDGFSEKMINRQNSGYIKDREKGPRFAEKGSFEYDFAMKWKELLSLEKLKKEQVEREVQLEKTRLMEEMDIMRYDYDMDTLRQRLKVLEARQEEIENRKLAAEKSNKAREAELTAMRKMIAKRQAEILGYAYEDEDEQSKQAGSIQAMQSANPTQQLMSGHPVADAVLGAALVPASEQPSAVAENFMKQWNSITKGVSQSDHQQNIHTKLSASSQPSSPQSQRAAMAGGQAGALQPGQGLRQQASKWDEMPMATHNSSNKQMSNSNMPAYMSYLGQQPNGKRSSDPGPNQKRRRY